MPTKYVLLTGRTGFLFDWLHVPPGDSRADSGREVTPQSYVLGGTIGLGIETRLVALQLGYGYSRQTDVRGVSFGYENFTAFADHYAGHLISLSLGFHLTQSSRDAAWL